jgi:signal transduction histidine kinase
VTTFRRTLGLRLSAWYAAVFILGTIALVAVTYALFASALAQRDHDIIRSALREYASRYELGGTLALERAVEIDERTSGRERLFVRVVGPDADALFVRMPQGWDAYTQENLGDESEVHDAFDNRAVLEVGSARLFDGTILQVGKSNEIRVALLRQFQIVVGIVSILALAIGVTGGLVLTRSTVQPIYDLIAVVGEIIRTGRTDTRVPERSEQVDAVDELSAQFNAMLDRITALIGAMGESLDNVAHDLRTPIARLRGIAERAMQSGDSAEQREALSDCLEESDRILSILNTLMDISEAEHGVLQLRRAPVPLGALLKEVVELYEDVADVKKVTVTLDAPNDVDGDVVVDGDRDRLRQAFANLLDNAIKYTPSGGGVRVSVRHDGQRAVVSVQDTGAGISAEHLPRIWERLYRADPSRSERGLGLGLSLVKAFVEAHGGTVEAVSEPGRGATFTVRLPVAPSPSRI